MCILSFSGNAKSKKLDKQLEGTYFGITLRLGPGREDLKVFIDALTPHLPGELFVRLAQLTTG